MSVNSERILVLAPSENDAEIAAQILREANLAAEPCRNVDVICHRISEGCGVVVIAEESLNEENVDKLTEILKAQEPWSDLPIILLTRPGNDKTWEQFSSAGNISILERPFSKLTLIRATQVAIRARTKQYMVRDLLSQQKHAADKRDEFFATLSHELRTPLSIILGWTELLRSGVLDNEESAAALDVLDRNAKAQKSLIDDLLDTSRIITGKLHFERMKVSLSSLLRSSQKAFSIRAAQKDIEMRLDVADESFVLGDEQRLTQVVSNLLTNAIKFTPVFGSITITQKRDGDSWLISVRDTGQGVKKAFLPFIFDRLKQEDSSTTRNQGGMGLGLSIAEHIIKEHGGTIAATSDGFGQGTEFVFRIPAWSMFSETASQAGLRELPIAKLTLEGLKLLVVDDSPDILDLISLWLRKSKADVRVVDSAYSALNEISIFQPDVLLSDVGMPGMDGYDFIRAVRAHKNPLVSHVPAIALTAYAKDEERERAIAAGFQMHISKPISYTNLEAAILSLAHLAELERQ